jgi:D-glycero-D-manno-heptose 1,7-bisphosphate phosphatase
MNKAIFLDRDGVINEAIFRENKATSPRNMDEWVWMDGIHQLVEKLKAEGYLIFVITNQPDIFRGIYPEKTMQAFHKMVFDDLQIDDLRACMHDDEHNCDCRKPKPGMLLDLTKKWDLDLQQCIFIGDTIKDVQAGQRADCFTILIDKHYNQGISCDHRSENIDAALEFINHFFHE